MRPPPQSWRHTPSSVEFQGSTDLSVAEEFKRARARKRDAEANERERELARERLRRRPA